ncbi:hypothetical protein F53441_10668 [Fusarium austroafricanum]|uniref:F-box domain-containing protein n=1 Tax=Fusarium austroafricanum TaxID=2364996 RepID=A0A8H4NP12_9HYPO|nr:hypothetical protein F53441_10668 [Fusarium austroafricanum]
MMHLPYSSLYTARQTCRNLRSLTDDSTFKAFHLEILQNRAERFCITEAGWEQLRTIKQMLLRMSLCNTCSNVLDSGELHRRLTELWQPMDCTGCQKSHPALFFPQNQKDSSRSVCVGLLGHFAICEHLKVSAKMETSEGLVSTGSIRTVSCDDPEHRPVGYKAPKIWSMYKNYTPFIQLKHRYHFDGVGGVQSFPMLKLDTRQHTDMGPNSIGWLSNLSYESDTHPIFNSHTKGVLWCQNPSCGTGHDQRWLMMVEIFTRQTLDKWRLWDELRERGNGPSVIIPLTLEYQTFKDSAAWTTASVPGTPWLF